MQRYSTSRWCFNLFNSPTLWYLHILLMKISSSWHLLSLFGMPYPVVYLPQKVQWIDLLVVPTLHLCEPALNYFILSQEKQTFLNILGGRFYVLVTPSWSVTTIIVGAKDKLSKTRVTRLVENVFTDLFHVMVFLPFPLSFHFLTIFFINQTIEKTIDLSLLYVVFPNGKKITL